MEDLKKTFKKAVSTIKKQAIPKAESYTSRQRDPQRYCWLDFTTQTTLRLLYPLNLLSISGKRIF